MWQKYKIEEGKIYSGKPGKIRFWIKKQQKIWQFCSSEKDSNEISDEGIQQVSKLPAGVEWTNIVADKHTGLYIVPALPDRPVIIKPEKIFTILAGTTIDIFARIPVWIQLYASSVKVENLIIEFPSIELSSTWFGDPDNGELAYSLPGTIHYQFVKEKITAYDAICPIQIRNDSDSVLNFQRLSVPVNELNIYSNQQILVSNQVRFHYKGEDKTSEVQIVSGSPTLVENLKQLSSARSKVNTGLLHKSFHMIKSFTQY
jgi:hypothetical protein